MNYCKCDEQEGDNKECAVHPPLYPLAKLESNLLKLLKAADNLAMAAKGFAETQAECGVTGLGYQAELDRYLKLRSE